LQEQSNITHPGHTGNGYIRYTIVTMLFIVTAFNFAGRTTMSIAGPAVSNQLHVDAKALGYIFSAFGWSYVLGQIPGGALLDRFGTKNVYATSIFLWSLFTLLQGFVGHFNTFTAIVLLFSLRLLLGLAESPCMPGNSRIVAAWFPASERGTACMIFNSAQYFALVLFAPIMGWIVSRFGWPYLFYAMGSFGIMLSFVWMKTVYSPTNHPLVTQAEVEYIAGNGGVLDLDGRNGSTRGAFHLASIRQLLANRLLLGISIGQYCIGALTYFFLTWFPVYLVQARGLSILHAGFAASVPALCGVGGSLIAGVVSDYLLRRGCSLTLARKAPIIVGLLLSVSIVGCNYVSSTAAVIVIMSIAFFGKGVGAMGWTVVADASPSNMAGLNAGLFNMFGNIPAIVTPIVIGYVVQTTKSFNGALIFVALNALAAVACYVFLVGEIKRVEI
jgi:ACS family glucarate transporter-like MFS transporter